MKRLKSRCRENQYHSVESLPKSQMQLMEVLYFFFTLASRFCNEHFSVVCPMARGLLLHLSLRMRKRNGFYDSSPPAHILVSQRKEPFIDFTPLVSSHGKCWLLGQGARGTATFPRLLGHPVSSSKFYFFNW